MILSRRKRRQDTSKSNFLCKPFSASLFKRVFRPWAAGPLRSGTERCVCSYSSKSLWPVLSLRFSREQLHDPSPQNSRLVLEIGPRRITALHSPCLLTLRSVNVHTTLPVLHYYRPPPSHPHFPPRPASKPNDDPESIPPARRKRYETRTNKPFFPLRRN